MGRVYVNSSKRVAPSSKQLDLLCLAVCSCCLTVLFHSAASLPQSAVGQTLSQRSMTTSNAPLTEIFKPFTIPASRPEVEDEEP